MNFIAGNFKLINVKNIEWHNENDKVAMMEVEYEDYIPEGKEYRMEYSEFRAKWMPSFNPVTEEHHFTVTWYFKKNNTGKWEQIKSKSRFPPKNFIHLNEREIPFKIFESFKLEVLIKLGEF